jgi:hemerythrin
VAKLVWTDQLNIGVEVIDQQHRRILDYINQLDSAHESVFSSQEMGKLIHELVDYTVSHFGFEESLQEESGYPFLKAHKKVHELFAKRVSGFQDQFDRGENVSQELHRLLVNWLVNHIRVDDADYVESVKTYMRGQSDFVEKKKGLFARLFG